jgi:RNA polymerase sigma-70 factor (ECF subfamily)
MNHDDSIPTRHSLLNRLKNWGDEQSWQTFFETYWKFIYGVAIKAGLTDSEAQDVVQETVITVAKKIKDFQVGSERGSFKAWLAHTTRWKIADQFRKRTRAAAQPLENSSDSTAGTALAERVPDPASLEIDAAWEKDWEQNLFDVALEKLKTRLDNDAFQMFYLHVVQQWPVAKVAHTTGAKTAQVYFAKYKASRLIKKEIERLKQELI